MKIHKYQPGTFIEIDDMAGGRRVAMVCKDGVTFWDLLDPALCTPLTIHPSMNPQELGSLVTFSQGRGLAKATQALVAHLRAAGDQRLDHDPLFVMRALWFVAKRASPAQAVPDAATLVWACEQAQAQAQSAARIHQLAGQYCAG
ncbi:hypothetical protein F3J44_15040 [Pantoea sp. Tr-811]|uniref:hypothetical protein n=1 Tax=Pantoea sp. Tr-811 TaxID=2608361 RepID=UPI00141F62DB|nr:hypothetical protein [Pantoea sp. Tr-811]NIF27684.1 hypothetical protein [Pantoea sp. Tr-811]